MHPSNASLLYLRRAVRPAMAATPASSTAALFCSCRLVRAGRSQPAMPAPVMPAREDR